MSWFRWRLSSLLQMPAMPFPKFPRPMPVPRGFKKARPIILTMWKTQVPESEYLFPEVANRYVQWVRQIAAWLALLLLVIPLFVIFPILCVLLVLLLYPFAILYRQKDPFVRHCYSAAGFPTIFVRRYRHSFERREMEWDYEMGKPIPLSRERKRPFYPTRSNIRAQSSSLFLTKLPVELRLEIYKHVFIGDGIHTHVEVHWTRKPG